MTCSYGKGKKWKKLKKMWIRASKFNWFWFADNGELVGYGECNDIQNPDDLNIDSYLTIAELALRKNPRRRFKRFKSLKSVMRFVRKCPQIKKGQKVLLISGYVGYADIEITK